MLYCYYDASEQIVGVGYSWTRHASRYFIRCNKIGSKY